MTQASKQTNCYVISPIGYTCIQRLLIFSKVNISIIHIQSFHLQCVGFAKHHCQQLLFQKYCENVEMSFINLFPGKKIEMKRRNSSKGVNFTHRSNKTIIVNLWPVKKQMHTFADIYIYSLNLHLIQWPSWLIDDMI